jgi:outer membrane lipoprotein LolB
VGKLFTRLLPLMVAAALSACATTGREAPPPPAASGRMALQIAAHGAEAARGFSGQFELRGSAETGSLELSGPLGAGWAQASWATGRFRLQTSQQTFDYASLDELTQAGLGEALPLAALFDWLKGRPWPGAAFAGLGEGSPGFVQLGWRIDTGDLAAGRLRAQRLQAPAITLRILLDSPTGS